MRIDKWMLLFMLLCGTAQAQQQVNVSYSADAYMETADSVMKGPVYYAPGMERREYVQDGDKTVMIVRHDKKVVWMLMPDDKMYMETKFPKEGRKDDLSNYKIEQTKIGPETVNGVKTTKSKIIMTGPNDTKMGGFMWTSKEGITVKLDAIAVQGGSKERFKTELQNLKIGKQDASLFEIPSGYTKMDMGGLGAMMKGMSDDEEDNDNDDSGNDQKAPEEKPKKGFGLKDALDILR